MYLREFRLSPLKKYDYFPLLGFEDRVMVEIKKDDFVRCIRLVMLTSSVAAGAAVLAAHVKLALRIPRDHCQEVMAEFSA